MLFAMGSMAHAQLADLGVRFGGGQGYGAALSTMWGGGSGRIEADLGWSSHGTENNHHNAVSLTGIYQWKGDIASGFGWFAGVGAHLGMWFWDGPHNGHDSDFALALAAQAGLEYNFKAVPIQLTLDIRPRFYVIPETDFHWGDIAFGIRYRF